MFKDLPEGQTWDQGRQDEVVKLNRLEWIAALESGKYKQAPGTLRDIKTDGYCCLGVLCDILDSSLWEVSPLGDEYFWKDQTNFLPPVVVEEMTFAQHDDPTGECTDPLDLDIILMAMNDTHGKTFVEIAEYLREIWELPK